MLHRLLAVNGRVVHDPGMQGGSPHFTVYRKRGKIRWEKHSRFQPYEVFRGNTLVEPWPAVFII